MDKVKTIFLVLVFGLIAIFLQGSVLRTFLPDFLVPNFLISMVVFLAFYENSSFGALLVFLLGIEFDLYAGQPLLIGPSAGAFVASFGLLASLSQRIFFESGFAIFIVTLISAIFNSLVHAVMIYEFNIFLSRYFSLSIITACMTALFTPFVFKLFRLIFGRRGGKSLMGRSRTVSV